MNNPLQIMQIMQNPMSFANMLLNDKRICSDPRIVKTSQLIQNHDTNGLKDMAENLCKSYGTTPEQVGNMIRQQFNI